MRLVAAFAFLLLTGTPLLAQDCPEPMRPVANNIKGEIQGKAQTLLKIGAAEVGGNVESTTVNLFEKFPNADRVAILQNFQSIACNILRNSNLDADKKTELLLKIIDALSKYLPKGETLGQLDTIERALAEFVPGKTNLEYIESIVGKPQFRSGGDAKFEKPGYVLTAHFFTEDVYYFEPKGAVFSLMLRSRDWERNPALAPIKFDGPWNEAVCSPPNGQNCRPRFNTSPKFYETTLDEMVPNKDGCVFGVFAASKQLQWVPYLKCGPVRIYLINSNGSANDRIISLLLSDLKNKAPDFTHDFSIQSAPLNVQTEIREALGKSEISHIELATSKATPDGYDFSD